MHLTRATLLATIMTVAPSLSLCAPAPSPQPTAVIYRGPATCDGCPEAIGNLLSSSRYKFKVVYAGPKEKQQVNAATLAGATIYAHGGGPSQRDAWKRTKGYTQDIQNFVKNGGRYMGICLGAYLAGPEWGYDLLPKGVDTSEEIDRKGAAVKDQRDTVIQLDWKFVNGSGENGRWVYFQDGVVVTGMQDGKDGAKVIGRYQSNGDVAASLSPYGKGWVGLSGPHPEADQTWYDDTDPHVTNPDGIKFDIGYDLIDQLMAGGSQ